METNDQICSIHFWVSVFPACRNAEIKCHPPTILHLCPYFRKENIFFTISAYFLLTCTCYPALAEIELNSLKSPLSLRRYEGKHRQGCGSPVPVWPFNSSHCGWGVYNGAIQRWVTRDQCKGCTARIPCFFSARRRRAIGLGTGARRTRSATWSWRVSSTWRTRASSALLRGWSV